MEKEELWQSNYFNLEIIPDLALHVHMKFNLIFNVNNGFTYKWIKHSNDNQCRIYVYYLIIR